MRRSPARFVALLALACATSIASAGDLSVGDQAPPLSPAKWVKGEPVKSFDGDKIYVVEFWATWCGPCKASIPHLSELQAKYKDVVFIGQDVFEQEADSAKVEPFVKEMGDKMNYRVAIDDKSADKEGSMATTWMEASGRNMIPTAFIVNKGGTIAWIGHPMSMEPVLEKVVNGTFDAAAAKKEADVEAAQRAEAQKIQGEFNEKVGPLLGAKNFTGAANAVDGIMEAHPDMAKQLRQTKFGILLAGKEYDAAYKVADQIADDSKDDAQALNALAWTIVDNKSIEQRDLDRAEKYAQRAVDVSEGKIAAIIDTLARVYADKGELDKAVDTETKAVAVADSSMKTDLQKTLDAYKAKQAK